MDSKNPSHVRYSGFLSFPIVVALGAAISVGLGIFLLIGPILQRIGTQTQTAYFLTIPFFFPIILTLAERAAVFRGNGGLFNLAKRSDNVFINFVVGWLVLGGYLMLGATLAWGGGLYLQIGLLRYFDLTLNPLFLGAVLIFLVTIYPLYGTSANWVQRSTLIYITIAWLIFLLGWALLIPPENATGYAYILSGNQLEAIPYLGAGLWGISLILDRRQQLKRGSYWSLRVLSAPIILFGLLGAFAAFVLLKYPRMIAGNLPPLVALAASINGIFELLIILATIAIVFLGLNQSLVSGVRLAGLMTESGFLHREFNRISPKHQYPVYASVFMACLMALMLMLVPVINIVTAVSGTLMIAIALVHFPGLLSLKSSLPENRPIKLPLHPLFPAITIAITLTLAFLPPVFNQFLLGFWFVIGCIYYLLYARRGAIEVRQHKVVVADADEARSPSAHRIMVAVHDLAHAKTILDTAVALAKARQAELIFLQIVVLPEQTTDEHRRDVAQAVWQQLNEAIQTIPDSETKIRPLVRLAPTVSEGLLSTIWEEKVDTCILGWPDELEDRERVQDGVVYEIVQKASCEVLIPHGEMPQNVHNVLVPMISETHATAALGLGQAFTGPDQGKVVALSFVREAMTPERSAAAYGRVQEYIAKLDSTERIEPLVEQTKTAKQLVIDSAPNYDLTILGVSDEGFLAITRFGGEPTEIALAAEAPVFLVKSKESSSRFWFRRTWQRLFDFFPTLTSKEQAAVYLNMRRDAKASIDFYILIVLATAIAYFGLLQNSDAVIIGAMLIAPLMSPILALSHGIVQGNAYLMREAFQAMVRGAILAIALTTVATLFMLAIGASIPATNAILSRTSPGLLDLMVALVSGLAAAYATSRSNVAGALPGVAIAAALVPPLAVVGYGLGLAQFDIASGALLLFLTNLAAIILAAAIIFLLLGFRPPMRVERDEQTRFGLRVAAIALVAVTIPLFLATVTTSAQTEIDNTISTMINEYWLPDEAQVTNIQIERNRETLIVSFDVSDFTGTIGIADIAALQQEISDEIDRVVTLRSVITQSQLDVVDESFDPVSLTPTSTSTTSPNATPTTTAITSTPESPLAEGTPTP